MHGTRLENWSLVGKTKTPQVILRIYSSTSILYVSKCYYKTRIYKITPATGSTYPDGSPPAMAIVKEVLKNMSTPVILLDITRLSQLRKDGHPSIYTGLKGDDCSHRCLAGVPDTWNQLLYAILSTGEA